MPSIAEDRDVSLGTAQWILTAAMIAAAVATPALGRWGSGRLRRPVMLGALVLVLVGCVLSALPLPIGWLIGGRALQGVGIALTPLALAVARDAWTGDRLATRLSLLSVTTVAGAGVGYPATALVASYAGISGAYVFGAVLTAATLALGWWQLPREADGEPHWVDVVGVGLLATGTSAVLLGISQGEAWGWSSPTVLGVLAGGTALVAAWVVRTQAVARSGRQPLVDLHLARRPGVLGPHVVALALAIGMYGLLTLVVLLVRADGSQGWGLDLGVAAAGTVLVPYAVMSVAGSRLALRTARRFGHATILPIGSVVFASSLALLAVVHDHLWQALLAMTIGGLGSGFSFSSIAMLMVPHVPAEETGSAMAFNMLLRYLGFAIGSAVNVALLTAYGGDAAAFRAAALTLGALCLAAGVFVSVRRPGPA